VGCYTKGKNTWINMVCFILMNKKYSNTCKDLNNSDKTLVIH
jgi:hypothetical protein